MLSKGDRDWLFEDLLDLFMLSYTLGCEQVTNDIPGATAFYGEADTAIYTEVNGKTWETRLDEALDGDNPLADIARIAETEAHRDYNTGAFDTATRAGAKMKTWRTMEDELVRDTHDYIDRVTAPINGSFVTSDGDSARFPGDFTKASNNVNCRCYITYS